MSKHLVCVFLLALILTSSCNDNSEENVETVCLVGQSLRLDTTCRELFPKYLLNDILISQKIFGERHYYGIPLKNDAQNKPELLFRTGHGHKEFNYLTFSKKDNSMIMVDALLNVKSLTVIPQTESINKIKNDTIWGMYSFKKIPPFRYTGENFYSMSDSTILVVGAPFDRIGHIFSIIDFRNSKVFPLEFWPNDGIIVDSLVKHSVYADYGLVFGNGEGRYLYKCGRERYAFIFTIEGNNINVIKNLYTVYSDYKTENGKDYITKSRKAEELSTITDNKYIYILLKEFDKEGNKLKKYSPNIYGNKVEVYDWDGNKVCNIVFDHFGQRLMLSEKNKKLYLFTDDYDSDDFNPAIWIYNLSNILK